MELVPTSLIINAVMHDLRCSAVARLVVMSAFIQETLRRYSTCISCSKRVCATLGDPLVGVYARSLAPITCECFCHLYVNGYATSEAAAMGDLQLLRTLVTHGYPWTQSDMIEIAENGHYHIIREREATSPRTWEYEYLIALAVMREDRRLLDLLCDLGYSNEIPERLGGRARYPVASGSLVVDC